jgi:hypothetical protein
MMSLALRYHVHTRHIERHHHELWVWNGLYYGEESKGVRWCHFLGDQ